MIIGIFNAFGNGLGGVAGPVLFGAQIATASRDNLLVGYLIGGRPDGVRGDRRVRHRRRRGAPATGGGGAAAVAGGGAGLIRATAARSKGHDRGHRAPHGPPAAPSGEAGAAGYADPAQAGRGCGCARPARPAMPRRGAIVREHGLVTVCEEAGCPNIGECWEKSPRHHDDHGRGLHARLRLLQRRHRQARAARSHRAGARRPRRWRQMGLKHVVITSVDRDDLADGGAAHFAATVAAIRAAAPGATIEILTPDFLRKPGAAEIAIDARPDVFNHNLETVPRLYHSIRPGARYYASLRLLERVKERDPDQFTKSGLMVGLGESQGRGAAGDGRHALRRRRLHHHRPVPAADAASTRRSTASSTPEEFAGAGDHRLRQGLPDGRRQPADALLAPRRRGLRAAAGGARAPAAAARLSAVAPQPDAHPALHARRSCSSWSATSSAIRSSCPGSPAAQPGTGGRTGRGSPLLDAEAEVGFSIVHERFSTRVRLDEPALAIDVDLISGPFRRLENHWRFAPHATADRADLRDRLRVQVAPAAGAAGRQLPPRRRAAWSAASSTARGRSTAQRLAQPVAQHLQRDLHGGQLDLLAGRRARRTPWR